MVLILLKISIKNQKIAVIGLGYVGLPLALEFAKNRSVVGYDIDTKRIDELRSGYDRTLECSSDLLASARFLKLSSAEKDLKSCGIYIVTVPTPIDKSNRPDLEFLIKASELVGRYLKHGNIVIYESTVFPGATEEICVPILEQISGLRFNEDFYCGYSPERINPGDKVNTLSTITKIVSGSTPEAAEAIDLLYSEIVKAGTFCATSMRVAEAAKVIENTQRDLNIAFVNELSVIFERLNIDTTEVLEAAGTKWNFLPFRPGMVGGHCIGVDPYYLTHKAEQVGYNPQIVLAGRRMNDNMGRYAARNVVKRMSKLGVNLSRSTVGVLGVTFKENCPDIRNSKVFDLIAELSSWGVNVVAIDPWADADEVFTKHGVNLVEKLATSSCDAIIVAVGHSQFREISPIEFSVNFKNPEKAVLGDLKSLYDLNKCLEIGFDVFRF